LGLCVFAFIALALPAAQARAETAAADFESANTLYGQGKFNQAAAAYEKLIQSHRASAAVYFNLGNAFFKAGQIGRALAAYRQAEQLTPGDPDVRANLQFARSQVQGPTLPPGRLQRWLGRLTLNEWAGFAAAAVWVWFILLTLPQLRPALKPALKSYLLPLGLVAAVLCACLGAALYQNRFTRSAIVVAHDTIVHTSPLDESQTAFTAHDGAELRVLDQKDEWFQVSTDPRHIGWLRRDQVALWPRNS
jgi:tetratricopeptide (TPR) repeat protein